MECDKVRISPPSREKKRMNKMCLKNVKQKRKKKRTVRLLFVPQVIVRLDLKATEE